MPSAGDRAKIAKALTPGGKGRVFSPDCGKPILVRAVIGEKFDSPAVEEQVREMQSEGQAVIDNERRGWRNPLDGRERLPET